MFEKKCKRCSRKLDKHFEFCPFCGFNVKKEQEDRDFGILGKKDEIDNFENFGMKMPFGFNRIFSSLLKQLDKQFKEVDKEIGQENKEKSGKLISKGLSISISTSNDKEPEIKIRGFGPGFENFNKNIINPEKSAKEIAIPKHSISDYKAKKLSKLPRQEAGTTVRRLSNKIIYEINLPGIYNLKDVFINKLENSIEIKAFSKDKSYFKLIPVNLPLLNYKLEDNKLILELKTK